MRIWSIFQSIFFIPKQRATVDPNDDSIDRWIVRHFRYDPERRERRHVVIACFGNRREFMKFIKQASAELQQAKLEGSAEQKEYISGVTWKAGYKEEINKFRHLLKQIRKKAKLNRKNGPF